jgi:GT2 family glycosyltransferase
VEYGWEDIELGMRLRAAGVRGIFNRFALAFHYKPRPRPSDVAGMLRQARAQARSAVQLRELQPHWRVVLATGDDPLRRKLHRAARKLGALRGLERSVGALSGERALSGRELAAARALARETYYAELDAARAQREPA